VPGDLLEFAPASLADVDKAAAAIGFGTDRGSLATHHVAADQRENGGGFYLATILTGVFMR
jgi:hypothetical protein